MPVQAGGETVRQAPCSSPRPLLWGAMDSPLGRLYVAAGPGGALVRLTYGVREEEFLAELDRSARNGPAAPAFDPGAVAPILRQLDQYFTGARRRFRLEVDLSGLPSFQRRVLEAVRSIPYGRAWSYGQVAAAVGKPGAARAVGRALAQNPVGIVIPCHRVVAADGSLHGFTAAGGLEAKRFLLELEGWQQGRLG